MGLINNSLVCGSSGGGSSGLSEAQVKTLLASGNVDQYATKPNALPVAVPGVSKFLVDASGLPYFQNHLGVDTELSTVGTGSGLTNVFYGDDAAPANSILSPNTLSNPWSVQNAVDAALAVNPASGTFVSSVVHLATGNQGKNVTFNRTSTANTLSLTIIGYGFSDATNYATSMGITGDTGTITCDTNNDGLSIKFVNVAIKSNLIFTGQSQTRVHFSSCYISSNTFTGMQNVSLINSTPNFFNNINCRELSITNPPNTLGGNLNITSDSTLSSYAGNSIVSLQGYNLFAVEFLVGFTIGGVGRIDLDINQFDIGEQGDPFIIPDRVNVNFQSTEIAGSLIIDSGSTNSLSNSRINGEIINNGILTVYGGSSFDGFSGTGSAFIVPDISEFHTNYELKTASFTLDSSMTAIKVDATLGDIVITANALASYPNERIFKIKRMDSSANTVTFQPDGTETIVGLPSRDIAQYEHLPIQVNIGSFNFWGIL